MPRVKTNLFKYKPLSSEDIRLLRILSASDIGSENANEADTVYVHPDIIRVELLHVSRAHPREYRALSYYWGDPSSVRQIIVDGKLFVVPESLESALRHLSGGLVAGEDDCFLWADAICINQEDNEEKATHVKMMKQTYEEAQEVVIWLGSGSPAESAGLEYMGLIGRTLACDTKYTWDTDPQSIEKDELDHLAKVLVHGSDKLKFDGVAQLLQSPWFTRAWVQQELAVAKSAIIVCGPTWIPFNDFERAYLTCRKLGVTIQIKHFTLSIWFQKIWDLLRVLVRFRKSYRLPVIVNGTGILWKDDPVEHTLRNRFMYRNPSKRKRLIDFITSSYKNPLNATNPCDMVYAFLGICADSDELQIEPRYNVEWPLIYASVTKALIETGDLNILTLCWEKHVNYYHGGRGYPVPSWIEDASPPYYRDISGNMPSWVLNIQRPPHFCDITRKIWEANLFNASLNSVATAHFDFGQQIEFPARLHVKGVYVDVIKEKSAQNKGKSAQDTFLADINMYLSRSALYTADEKQEASWRIPVRDMQLGECRIVDPTPFKRDYQRAITQRSKGFRGEPEIYSWRALDNYRLNLNSPFLSSGGYVGLCRQAAEPGDIICIVHGVSIPLLLRQTDAPDEYALIGELHVHGIMDGEFMHTNSQPREFRIV